MNDHVGIKISEEITESGGFTENRREFIQTMGSAGISSILAATSAGVFASATPGKGSPPPQSAEIPRRWLGSKGPHISALGIGGHHLGDFKNRDEAVKMIHAAIEAGVNFFDNCWEYYNGLTETILGAALKGRRDKAFLMTKVCTHGRGSEIAMQMLEGSLKRLQTDSVDLWQIHAISFDNDPELAYAKGGVLEALDRAKQQGKARFVGFTGHKEPLLHKKMLDMGYPFDTVQMPLNPFDHGFHSFETIVLPEANRRGVGVLGMKSMGGTGKAIKKGVLKAEEMLRYAMSLPVVTTISGIDSMKVLDQNLAVARGFKPYSEKEMNELRLRCAELAADGRFEPYKVSLQFDNPMTRIPHGFPIDKTQKEVKTMLKKGNGTWEPI